MKNAILVKNQAMAIHSYHRLFVLIVSVVIILPVSFSCAQAFGTRPGNLSLEQQLTQAEYLTSSSKPQEALVAYLILIEEAEKIGNEKIAGLSNAGVAELMRMSTNYKEEVFYAEKAVTLLEKAGERKAANANRWYIQSGYANLKNYQRSLSEGDRIYKEASLLRDTATMVKTLETAIHVYRMLFPKEKDSLFIRVSQLESLQTHFSCTVYSDLAAVYHILGKDSISRQCFEEALHRYNSDEQLIRILYERYLVSFDKGEKTAHEELQALWNLQQKVSRGYQAQSLLETMNAFLGFRVQQQMERNKQIKWMASCIISFVVLLLSFIITAYFRNKKIAILEQKHLSDALDAQVAALEELRKTLAAKDSLASRLEFGTLDTLCAEYYTGGHLKEKRVSQAFDQMVHKYREDPHFWDTFEKRVDEMHDGIVSQIKKEFENFKADDYRLVTYIISGMSYFSISVLMGVDKPVLYNRAKRLRDRIRSSEAPDKDKFLKALSRTPDSFTDN